MSKKNEGVRIIHTSVIEEAKKLLKEGWEPIEVSIGGESVVGRLKMDHHGEHSGLEGVAIRSYRDHFGSCRETQGYIVTGSADADATFAIAALSGLLPHPSRVGEFEEAPVWLKAAMTQDLTTLAELVNRVDCDPIGIELPTTHEGRLLLTWGAMSSGVEDRSAFHAGVDRWRALTGSRPPKALIAAAAEEESARRASARELDFHEHMGCVTVLASKVWGFDVWYGDFTPCVVALTPDGNITVGVVNKDTAEKMFGPGGLKNIFPKLEPEGWGGREAIGGSPRGVKMTKEQAIKAGRLLVSLAKL